MLIILAIIATILAFIQNSILFSFGFKEMAIFVFPFSFVGIFIVEIVLIWVGTFVIRRFIKTKREILFIILVLVILGIAELILPVNYFTNYFKHTQRENVLNKIELTGKSIELLVSENEIGSRIALKYSLQFPKTGQYLTFPAFVNSNNKSPVSGNYFIRVHPEYYNENFSFESNKPYEFIVVFDTGSKKFEIQDEANIDICDGKDYFMTCRIIKIGVGDLLRDALTSGPTPKVHEPTIPDNYVEELAKRDFAKENIRLADLEVTLVKSKYGAWVPEFSFSITNTSSRDIKIPNENLDSLIRVKYFVEAIDEAAKKQIIIGSNPSEALVTLGDVSLSSYRKDIMSPGQKISINESLNRAFTDPGKFKFRIQLLPNNLLAGDNNSVLLQELTTTFFITP